MKKNKKNILIDIIVIITIAVTMFFIGRKTKQIEYTIMLQDEQQISTLKTDENGIIKETIEPTKDGHIFMGWYIGDEKVDFSKPISEGAKLEEKWEKIEQQEQQSEESKIPDPKLENPNTELSVEWVKVKDTAIEQTRIYIKNSEGKYVSGTLEITTIAGDTFEENVTENGSENVYIKSVIKSVKIK